MSDKPKKRVFCPHGNSKDEFSENLYPGRSLPKAFQSHLKICLCERKGKKLNLLIKTNLVFLLRQHQNFLFLTITINGRQHLGYDIIQTVKVLSMRCVRNVAHKSLRSLLGVLSECPVERAKVWRRRRSVAL